MRFCAAICAYDIRLAGGGAALDREFEILSSLMLISPRETGWARGMTLFTSLFTSLTRPFTGPLT